MKYALLISTLLTSLFPKAQIQWNTDDWRSVIEQAEDSNKLIFIEATTQWCEPCKVLEQYTLSDLEVINYYNAHFMNVQMDMEEYPGIAFSEKYQLLEYPSLLIIDASGKVVHQTCGALEADDMLAFGEAAVANKGLGSLTDRYMTMQTKNTSTVVLDYLAAMEDACLDATAFANEYLRRFTLKELATNAAWEVFAAYDWDIYSRAFQHLLLNKGDYDKAIGKTVVDAKLYDAFLAQYQEVYVSQDLHDFGMRALLHEIGKTTFAGSDTLSTLMHFHYSEYTEQWKNYGTYAVEMVGMMGIDDPEELSDIAWKFYLFVDNKNQLTIASNWAKVAVDEVPSPANIDTYASLQFKLGNRKKAIELEKKALELSKELEEDTYHYAYQLAKFEE